MQFEDTVESLEKTLVATVSAFLFIYMFGF
jgi:hypothetical protein